MKQYTRIIQTAAWLAVLAFALFILNWLWIPLIWLLAGVGMCSAFHAFFRFQSNDRKSSEGTQP